MGTEDIVEFPYTAAESSVIEESESRMEDTPAEFDMSQFVDFDRGEDEDAKSVLMAIDDKIKQSSDDFVNDIEDDMLLDL